MTTLTRLLCAALAIAFASQAPAQPLTTQNLRCEYLTNPLGIDEPAPRGIDTEADLVWANEHWSEFTSGRA